MVEIDAPEIQQFDHPWRRFYAFNPNGYITGDGRRFNVTTYLPIQLSISKHKPSMKYWTHRIAHTNTEANADGILPVFEQLCL